ncbi:hypothetical protein BH23GEM9_BH23GEM9_26450 [soil metagenome]
MRGRIVADLDDRPIRQAQVSFVPRSQEWCGVAKYTFAPIASGHPPLVSTPSPGSLPPPRTSCTFREAGFDIDQTPAYDLTEPEPVPDFDFKTQLAIAARPTAAHPPIGHRRDPFTPTHRQTHL